MTNLQHRGLLEKTWIVITGDHGEGLGEHDLFEHGESLYSTEIRVPLLIVPPPGSQRARVVRDTVSLRDLPATIVDVVGLATGAPFPGDRWRACGTIRHGEPIMTLAARFSPSCDAPARSIPVMVDRRPVGDRSFPWPKAIWFTFTTKAIGPRSYTTGATIPAS